MLAGSRARPPPAGALERVEGLGAYRGAATRPRGADSGRRRARARSLAAVFDESTDFALSARALRARLPASSRTRLYAGRTLTTVVGAVFGLEIESDAVDLGDGLTLMRRAPALEPAPRPCAADGVPSSRFERAEQPGGRARLTAARRSSAACSPRCGSTTPSPRARPAGLGAQGRQPVAPGAARASPAGRAAVLRSPRTHEDELRAFCSLADAPHAGRRRSPGRSPRYEMGLERRLPFEGLTDHLLALRALARARGHRARHAGPRASARCAPSPASARRWPSACATPSSLERARGLRRPDAPGRPDALAAELAGPPARAPARRRLRAPRRLAAAARRRAAGRVGPVAAPAGVPA